MPFSLMNSHVAFMDLINSIFKDKFDEFMIIYIVYSVLDIKQIIPKA